MRGGGDGGQTSIVASQHTANTSPVNNDFCAYQIIKSNSNKCGIYDVRIEWNDRAIGLVARNAISATTFYIELHIIRTRHGHKSFPLYRWLCSSSYSSNRHHIHVHTCMGCYRITTPQYRPTILSKHPETMHII